MTEVTLVKTIARTLAFLLVLIALFVAPNRASAAGPSVAIVQWGDTLFAIAARYDTTVGALVRANALPSPDFIFAGQRLIIPASSPEPIPPRAASTSSARAIVSFR